MKVVALISGGKDSTFNVLKCVAYGHEVICLGNLKPQNDEEDELDSWCFQTVGHHGIEAMAQAWELPLVRQETSGKSERQTLDYEKTEQDEVEDLFLLLQKVKESFPEVQAVSSGAVLSNYQRNRVENVCGRLGLVSLAYMWQQDQTELVEQMINVGLEAIIIKVASMGLDVRHLGKTLEEICPHLMNLKNEFGMNVAGEGGEYESFTLDCPMWKYRLNLNKSRTFEPSIDSAHLRLEELSLEEKSETQSKEEIKKLLSKPLPKDEEPTFEVESRIRPVEIEGIQTPSPTTRTHRCGDFIFVSGLPRCDMANTDIIMNENEMKIEEFLNTSVIINGAPGVIQEWNENAELWSIYFTRSQNTKQFTHEELLKHIKSMKVIEKNVNTVLNEIEENLNSIDSSFSSSIFMQFYLNDISEFLTANSIYKQKFGINPPSRCCVELPLPSGQPILADCLAYQGKRHVLHVQSHSEWAPACIGPYSQCNMVNGLLFMAGQIALFPATMKTISNEEPKMHTHQTWSNTEACLGVLNSALCHCLTHIIFLKHQTSPGLNQFIENECLEIVSKQESDEFECHSVASLLFVEVPKMPRDALIEIIPFAYQKKLLNCLKVKKIDYSINNTKLTAINMSSCVSSVTIRVLDHQKGLDFTNDVWNLLGQHFTEIEMEPSEHILLIRAYYDVRVLEPNSFLKSLESSFASTFNDVSIPAISLIPSCKIKGGDDESHSICGFHVYLLNEPLLKETLEENSIYTTTLN